MKFIVEMKPSLSHRDPADNTLSDLLLGVSSLQHKLKDRLYQGTPACFFFLDITCLLLFPSAGVDEEGSLPFSSCLHVFDHPLFAKPLSSCSSPHPADLYVILVQCLVVCYLAAKLKVFI
jgi:hypothetical protein